MTEQIQDSTVTPSAVLAAEIVAPAATGSVVSAANLPGSGTFTLLLKGDADDGSDDGIITVGAIAGTAITDIDWIENGQGTFAAATEVELVLDARALEAVIDERADARIAADTTKQAADSQLTQLAALSPANDDVIQQKAGVLANRTMAQLASDLDTAGLATDSALSIHEADTTSVHGIADTLNQVPERIAAMAIAFDAAAATTANIALSGLPTIDGVELVGGNLVLVKDQSDPTENGLYSTVDWTRVSLAALSAEEVAYRAFVRVVGGTLNVNKIFAPSNHDEPVLGTDEINYVEVSGTLGVDPAPENRFAIDAVGLMFGDNYLRGNWSYDVLSVGTMEATQIYGAFDDGAMYFFPLYGTGVDGYPALLVGDSGSGAYALIGPKEISSEPGQPYTIRAVTSYVYLNGGQCVKMVYKSANYTVTIGDHEIIYTTLSAARTDTLPLLSTVPDGWWCVFGDGTSAGAAGTNNLIINEHATDGGSEVARLATNNHFVKVKKINGKWWRGPYELWTRIA